MLRVAPNDPALAHGHARFAIAELADRVRHLERRLIALSVKDASRVLRQCYGPMVLCENIVRATGSRARATWVALDSDGDELVPLCIRRWNHGNFARLTADALPIRIRRHALARLFQRTAGVADMGAVAPLLTPHVTAALVAVAAGVVDGQRLTTQSPAGQMIWQAVARPDGEPFLHARTWLAPDAAQ